MLLISCTAANGSDPNCQVTGSNKAELIFSTLIFVSLFGTLLNLLSLFVLVFSNNMTTKFLRYLRFSLVNSTVITVNSLLANMFMMTWNESPFGNDHKLHNYNMVSSYSYTFYYSYIYLPMWTLSYTYSSLMDIIIAYERILMYKPQIKFMRNWSIYSHLVLFLVISGLINLPANLSRDVKTTRMTFNSAANGTIHSDQYSSVVNVTVQLYNLGIRHFEYNRLFTVFLYVSTALRDILTLVVELVITIFLLVTVIRFADRKLKILKKEDETNSELHIFRKTEFNNSKITLFICFVSSFTHVCTFLVLVSLFFLSVSIYSAIATLVGFLFVIRHSMNFFILIRLNKKFKRNCIRLMPAFLKIKRGRVAPKASRSTIASTVNTVQKLDIECLDLDIITPLPKEVSSKKSVRKRSAGVKNQQGSVEPKSRKTEKDKTMETDNKEIKATSSGLTCFRNKDYQIWVESKDVLRAQKEKQLTRGALACGDKNNGIEPKSRKRIINETVYLGDVIVETHL